MQWWPEKVACEERAHQSLGHYHPKELPEVPHHLQKKYKINLINKFDKSKVTGFNLSTHRMFLRMNSLLFSSICPQTITCSSGCNALSLPRTS
jgi:hypothetical protein